MTNNRHPMSQWRNIERRNAARRRRWPVVYGTLLILALVVLGIYVFAGPVYALGCGAILGAGWLVWWFITVLISLED